MEIEIINLVLSGLSTLSKFKLILESEEVEQLSGPKDLVHFPPLFLIHRLIERQQQYLTSKFTINPNLKCRYYRIPYSQYTLLKNNEIGEKIDHE